MNKQISNLSPKELKRLVDRGIVDVMITPALQAYDVNKVPITALPEFEPFKKLAGHQISINAAARKYHLQPKTISRWTKSLSIPQLGNGPHGAKYFDEAHIAYYASRYKKLTPGPGRRTDHLF